MGANSKWIVMQSELKDMCKFCCSILQRFGILKISCKKSIYVIYVGIELFCVLSISEITLAL